MIKNWIFQILEGVAKNVNIRMAMDVAILLKTATRTDYCTTYTRSASYAFATRDKSFHLRESRENFQTSCIRACSVFSPMV
jgi:hypothetical protein